MSKCLLAVVLFASLSACIPKPTVMVSPGRKDAVATADYALAIAYDDDALLEYPYMVDVRAERVTDFEGLIGVELGKLGPLSDSNALAVFGELVALRREAFRGPPSSADGIPQDDGSANAGQVWTERREDLAAVDARVIAPKLAETGDVLWKAVETDVTRGDFAAALVLGAAVVDELPKGTPYAARLDAIGEQAAAIELGLAQQAGPDQYGARILHARLAEQFGANVGDLKAFPPELVAETALSWTVASDGDCGGSPANGYDSALVPLVTTLPRQGFTSGVGQPFALTVTFDSCPVTLKEWETQAETAPFTEDVQVEQLVVKTREVGCYTSSSQGPSTSSLSFGYDYDGNYIQTTTTTPGDVTTSTFGCTTEQYTDGETEIVTVTQERVENYGVSHRRHHASATGTIRIAFDGGVRDAPFAIEADSDDDLSYNPRHGSDRHGFHMLSEPQARDRLHDKLVAKIYEVRDQVLEARAQVFVAQAQESAAAGNAFGTDHAYFIASQITSRPAPQFSQWMQGRYRITNDVLVAAVGELPLPRLDVVAGHEVELPRVPINLRAHYYESPAMLAWERRRILMLTVTAGPTLSRHVAAAAP